MAQETIHPCKRNDGIFVDAPMFNFEINQIEKETQLLHQHEDDFFIDEGAEDEDTFSHEFHQQSSNHENWRDKKKHFPRNRFAARFHGKQSDFCRFPMHDWRNAKVAAKHLKFCPGDNCNVWLPLYHFGTNCNMEDGLDIYCIECNNRKRDERKVKKYEPPNKFKQGISPDKYERFYEQYKIQHPEPEESEEATIMREVNKRIELAVNEASHRFNRTIPIDAVEVARRLFMRRRFICNVTGQVLTPTCFLDHHFITFELKQKEKRKVMEIICNDCRTSLPPKETN